MIEVVQLAKSYSREKVLRDVSFTVNTAGSACIIGRNGSGKSTLLSIVAGRLLPDRGEVRIGGQSVHSGSLGDVGYLAQTDGLFDDLSVARNVAFWSAAAGVSKKQADRFIELLQLKPFWRKKVRELSGGMRQRTAICTALLHGPSCLLLDEPFTGLDLVHKEELLRYLEEIRNEGTTLLYTAHNIEEIGRLTDRLIVLHQGTTSDVTLEGPVEEMRETVMRLLSQE